MKFETSAKVDKLLWTNQQSFMYKVTETIGEKSKQWVIFTKQEVTIGFDYTFAGTVSESKDKKVQDANGRDIWRATFNAEQITESSAFPF